MAYVIGKNCSTCHYCFYTCPVKAIRFVGKEYAIDVDKCIDCGKCEEVCPAGIIYNPADTKKISLHQPEETSCDLVVLGGGGAGLIAAVRYKLLTGKSVIVLEKAKKPGGNTTLGHNFLTRYSKRHAQAGMPDLREKAIESICEGGSGNELSKNLLRKAMYAQSDVLDWLFDLGDLEQRMKLIDLREQGMSRGPFVFTPGFFDFPDRIENFDSTDHSMGPGWMGTWMIRKMIEQCKKLDIPILTQHRAIKLNMDANGKFQSVVAENPGGIKTVCARNCLIATGGFARNKEVLEKILPEFYEGEPVHSFTVASNTGDAITMAEDIGAKMDFEHVKIPMFGPVHHPYSFPVMQLVGSPRVIMVTLDGERFQPEDLPPKMELKGPLEQVKGKVAFAVFDSDTLELLGAEMMERTADDPGLHKCMTGWREELEYECTLDTPAKKAETIAELAQKAGIDAAGLEKEIAVYNSDCKKQKDSKFGKNSDFLNPIEKAPFYAVHLARFNEGAEGGIVNDDELRVVKKDGTPFDGLYIAGDPCRGVLKTDDAGGKFGEMPWAVASAYMVAENMAKEESEKN